MATPNAVRDKSVLWLSIFTILPAVFLWPLSEYLTEPGLTRILVSVLLGALGALLGFFLYKRFEKKPTGMKISGLLGLLIVGLLVTTRLESRDRGQWATCEVCGYQAIAKGSTECDYCASDTWEVEKEDGEYESKAEWLRDEQLFWFGLEEPGEKADFFRPAMEDGYRKDKKWRPVITQEDLEADLIRE